MGFLFKITEILMVDITSEFKFIELKIQEVTEGKIGGDGAFDVLMTGLDAYLQREYDAQRITGAEYTKAYIALVQQAMQESVQFTLGKNQALTAGIEAAIALKKLEELLPSEIALNKEKLETQRAQTLDTRSDGASVKGVLGQQRNLYAEQITSYIKDSELKAAKVFADAWNTQVTVNNPESQPGAFTLNSINKIFGTIAQKNDLGTKQDIMNPEINP